MRKQPAEFASLLEEAAAADRQAESNVSRQQQQIAAQNLATQMARDSGYDTTSINIEQLLLDDY